MIDRKNLLFSTFIGLEVEISNSSQRKLIGLHGKVVDETKNLIMIEVPGGKEVRVPKVSATFRFTLDDGGKMDVDGAKITFRPHERAKKV